MQQVLAHPVLRTADDNAVYSALLAYSVRPAHSKCLVAAKLTGLAIFVT